MYQTTVPAIYYNSLRITTTSKECWRRLHN